MTKLTKSRYLKKWIEADLVQKMIFIGGPRQVGKTTFALQFISSKAKPSHPSYLNWDVPHHREALLKNNLPLNDNLLIFDEIHKYSRWRQMIKGFYDLHHHDHRAIVTGSARLDYYRKGGDSLLGRYRYYRLHPYSLRELHRAPNASDLDLLMNFGGFPEPLHRANKRDWRIWQRERVSRVLNDDLRDLERVNEVSLIELMVEALPQKVGSPLSLQSLREDLQVSHDSIRRWLTICDNLYLTFRISPYGSPKIRAVKKEQKLYFWDWSQVENSGARFENLLASHLLKYCHYHEDTQGYNMELRYIRDTDGREIDFVVLKDGAPLFAVECKTGEKQVSKNISYFKQRTPIPEFYQVHSGKKDHGDPKINGRVMPFIKFVKELNLP